MKKIFATAGFAALGVASVYGANTSGLTPADTSKFWSVSAALRGFYDDNYALRPSANARESFGFEVLPSLKLNYVGDQTAAGFSYDYGMRYYEDRANNSADHTHQVSARLNHAISERHKIDVSDSFVVAQEPLLLEPSGPLTTPLRSDGNNIRNTGNAAYTGDITQLLSVVLSYSNSIYDYSENGAGSYSALLDRMEHLAMFNLRWTAMSTTAFLVGYNYSLTEHTSKDSLIFGPYIDPEIRDSESHYAYVGVDHSFTSQLSASARVGAQFTRYQNALPGTDKDRTSPYADGSFTWTYNPGSSIQVGVRHALNQTDIGFYSGGTNPTLDQESTTIYGNLTHKITAKLKGSVLGQYQNSTFNGGVADGQVDDYYSVGVNLSYQFNTFLSAETGYSYDRLESDLNARSFTRNRVYIGIRAVY